MSGFTGVAAVVDAGLEKRIDISLRRRPSFTIMEMNENVDILVIANSAKTRESALRFGSIVFSRVEGHIDRPLIQVDDGIIIDWTGKSSPLCELLANELKCEVIDAPMTRSDDPDTGWRYLGGVIPGESVWVNGIVVGRATTGLVLISHDEEGRLIARGMDLKPTGVNRLGRFDVGSARVRSGTIRRTKPLHTRSLASEGKYVHLVDHNAESSVYDCRGAALAITVGDDTSRIAGNLLFRFGVPVVAITDGDEDCICTESMLFPGSIIIRVLPGTDDLVGAEVRSTLFKGESRIREGITPSNAAQIITRIAGDRFLWCKRTSIPE